MCRWLVPSSVPILVAVTPAAALANPGAGEVPRIYGGTPVPACGWPTTVSMPSGCTGTLIHPQVAIYAAHCGGGGFSVRFGESAGNPGRTVPASCTTNPGYAGAGDQGHDWALCVLNQPVTELPYTPPLVGCDLEALAVGSEVTIVGFGDLTEQGGYGTKRWANTILGNLDLDQNIANVGGMGLPSVCPGDSGGPIFVQVKDGTWRTLGIASTVTGGCGGLGTHSLVPGAVAWVEATSGIDVTPCTDAEGNWEPGPGCGGFFAGNEQGHGDWANWCAGTPAGDTSRTCGPGYGDPADMDPPSATLVAPGEDQVFDTAPGVIDPIIVEADDGAGWGVVSVELVINGDSVGIELFEPPWEFTGVQFPKGTWELQAVARDWYGQEGTSEIRTIWVETEPPPGDGDGDGDGGGDAGDTGDDGGTGGGDGDGSAGADGDQAGGCGCSTSPARTGAWLLAWAALAGRRRRSCAVVTCGRR
jgi:MYXO-CTERM domain-containing protein